MKIKMAIYRCSFLLFLSAQLSSCYPEPPDKAPAVTRAELRAHGITISSANKLPGATFRGECSASGNYAGLSGAFNIIFSPHTNYSFASDFQQPFEGIFSEPSYFLHGSKYPYEFSFSIEAEGVFTEIPAYSGDFLEYLQTLDFYEVPDAYVGTVTSQDFIRGFVLFGDYYLVDSPAAIPSAATHIELWFRDSKEGEKYLLYRTALENLTSWKTYIRPLLRLDENGERICRDV